MQQNVLRAAEASSVRFLPPLVVVLGVSVVRLKAVVVYAEVFKHVQSVAAAVCRVMLGQRPSGKAMEGRGRLGLWRAVRDLHAAGVANAAGVATVIANVVRQPTHNQSLSVLRRTDMTRTTH